MSRIGVIYNREELAWAAGLFDGEGYIGCHQRKLPSGRGNARIALTVVQWHDADVIVRFHAAIGGLGRRSQRRRERGAIEYRLGIQTFEAVQAAVALLWPWLSGPKRAQATRSLEQYHGLREMLGTRAWRRQRLAAAP